MSDVDRIADALFERIRRLAVSALTQPLGAGGLVVAEIANTESGATLNAKLNGGPPGPSV